MDSGKFGDQGIRYSLSGSGSNLFHVDDVTGAITVAPCVVTLRENNSDNIRRRRRRDTFDSNVMRYDDDIVNDAKNVNLTLVGETGIIQMVTTTNTTTQHDALLPTASHMDENDAEYKVFSSNDEYVTMHDMGGGGGDGGDGSHDKHEEEHYLAFDVTSTMRSETSSSPPPPPPLLLHSSDDGINSIKPGVAPCLDFETQPVYFLSYKVSGFFFLASTTLFYMLISVFSLCSI